MMLRVSRHPRLLSLHWASSVRSLSSKAPVHLQQTKLDNVRVRFAPSPTGRLHLGGLRTALFNILFARKHNGVAVLRIEDTDQNRLVPGAADGLVKSLTWAGLEFDEGPHIPGGPYGPYVQSERLALYQAHAKQLLAAGTAYRCFCPPVDAEARKEEYLKDGASVLTCPCCQLSARESQDKAATGSPFCVKLRNNRANELRTVEDVVYGNVVMPADRTDAVLLKRDGWPTYHLANVVDDHLMKISHVMRGWEWLSSTPKHYSIYEAFGWKPPVFVHLPLLMNSDGSKLSKRQNDVFLDYYRDEGYTQLALLNFVAGLGWTPKHVDLTRDHGGKREPFSTDGSEIRSLDQMAQQFTLDRIHKDSAIVNLGKLRSLSKRHLGLICEDSKGLVPSEAMQRSIDQVKTALTMQAVGAASEEQLEGLWTDRTTDTYIEAAIVLLHQRISRVAELLPFAPYLWCRPDWTSPEVSAVLKETRGSFTNEQIRSILNEFLASVQSAIAFYEDTVDSILKAMETRLQLKSVQMRPLLRWAVSGSSKGASLSHTMVLLGRDVVLDRVAVAAASLSTA